LAVGLKGDRVGGRFFDAFWELAAAPDKILSAKMSRGLNAKLF